VRFQAHSLLIIKIMYRGVVDAAVDSPEISPAAAGAKTFFRTSTVSSRGGDTCPRDHAKH